MSRRLGGVISRMAKREAAIANKSSRESLAEFESPGESEECVVTGREI